MKFLCDQMLARVGRWLRAAGYDTEIVQKNLPDAQILEWANREHRFLLSRDKHFLEMTDNQNLVVWLSGNRLQDIIEEMNGKLPMDWLLSPFSRCLVCNTLLIDAPQNAKALVPEDIREEARNLRYCPQCRKPYWEGSHTKRMLSHLKKWNAKG